MTILVHFCDIKNKASLLQNGIKASKTRISGVSGVYCLPLIHDQFASYQWIRELRKHHTRPYIIAVHFKIKDSTEVFFEHYHNEPKKMTLKDAVSLFSNMDPKERLGYEMILPGKVSNKAIHAIRQVKQIIGWRHYPNAHGNYPLWYFAKGDIKSSKKRQEWELAQDGSREKKGVLRNRLEKAIAANNKQDIIKTMESIGKQDWKTIHCLASIFNSEDTEIQRMLAAILFGFKKDPKAIERLMDLSLSADKETQENAITNLIGIQGEQAIEWLAQNKVKYSDDMHQFIREWIDESKI